MKEFSTGKMVNPVVRKDGGCPAPEERKGHRRQRKQTGPEISS